ncbi:MAG: translesion error-prone DNA polymerase V autoproteolytic subunit [Sulfurimicrobium sp.]|nr:translesion error-prone DNA polymerase V autoproteolytic subunit [Sulfurimicrobium sp.]MDP2197252.1 translesion error-prone DNA polymerase V autoproteolytic subunit [Sulfurimicrobium sp.]MDP2961978.1 translesion error-prone DNA polymerase V autoproteolytic subunit [Sulfurimicrobium sp.]
MNSVTLFNMAIMTQSTRGGARPGAGRKPSPDPSTTIRVPGSQKAAVLDFVRQRQAGLRIPSGMEIFAFAEHPPRRQFPLMSHAVRAGFPSPADDYVEKRIDLNEELIQHREATFFLRVKGQSMVDAGIDDGDELIVDRAIKPEHGRIVIAAVDGELTVKRFFQRDGVVKLIAENPKYPDIEFKEGQEMLIWGVVTRIIKSV